MYTSVNLMDQGIEIFMLRLCRGNLYIPFIADNRNNKTVFMKGAVYFMDSSKLFIDLELCLVNMVYV